LCRTSPPPPPQSSSSPFCCLLLQICTRVVQIRLPRTLEPLLLLR
jgi:hypothetical protein